MLIFVIPREINHIKEKLFPENLPFAVIAEDIVLILTDVAAVKNQYQITAKP